MISKNAKTSKQFQEHLQCYDDYTFQVKDYELSHRIMICFNLNVQRDLQF